MKVIEPLYIYKLNAGEKLAWHGRYHSHDEHQFEIHFFTGGTGTFCSNDTVYAIGERRMVLCLPHEFHSIMPETPLSYYAVLFSIDDDENELYQLLMNAGNHEKLLKIEENDIMTTKLILDDILHLSGQKSPDLQKSCEYLLKSSIYRWFGTRNSSSSHRNDSISSKMHMEKAIKIMKENTRKNRSIDFFADSIYLSKEHFIRMFKKNMNMTPHQYFLRLRIQEAASELTATGKKISVIAEEFEFENQFHFARVFKKCTGLSPTDYKNAFSQGDEI